MRKGILFFGLIGLLLLTACGKTEVTDYIEVEFSGVESVGKVNYSIDTDQLLVDIFDVDFESDFPEGDALEEMNAVMDGYKVKVEPENGLSNGDKVTVTVSVDKDKTKKIKDSKKEFTVEGLDESLDVAEFASMTFEGLDSQGKAEYSIDEDDLIAAIFGQDGDDAETEEEISRLKSAYTVEVDQEDNLSNGDKVTLKITVDEDQTKLIKSSEREFTVSDLGESTVLTEDEVEKNLVVNFNGTSGKGEAKIDNTFDSPLDYFDFQIENDGELKNGDEATILMDKETQDQLHSLDYIVEKDFNPVFKVKGLDEIAEKATDISNLDDIKRMIEEELKREYEDLYPDDSFGHVYETTEEKFMYRQFDSGKNETSTFTSTGIAADHGNLIGIYSVNKYSGGDDRKLEGEFTAVIGFSGITIVEDDKADLSEMESFTDERDDTYSLESVIQLYEGYGYTEVKK